MKLNEGQTNAFEAIKSGRNVFLTGQAGTGKSELIKEIKRFYEEHAKICYVTSLTGNSAMQLKGTTIHRWSGYGIGRWKGQELLEKVRKNRNASRNWRSADLLIIDEISMMSPDMFDDLNFVGKSIRRMSSPFGGIQILITGDLCQLGAVATDAYCFESKSWAGCNFDIHYLQENMRQDEPLFRAVLAEIRMGVVSQQGRDLLESRLHKQVEINGIHPTKLFPKRKAADEINTKRLKEIINDANLPQRFEAIDYFASRYTVPEKYKSEYIAALNKACQAKPILDLCVGAQVILIHNLDIDMALVNGSSGVIIGFEELRPFVRFSNGIEMIISHHDWEVKISDDLNVCRRQIPLVLGYAITVHRAQGMTLDCVELDLGDDIFADGQFYTSLSRVRTVKGLSITNLNFNSVRCDPKVRSFYRALEAPN